MKKKVKKRNPPQPVIAEDKTENHTAKRYFLFTIITACQGLSKGVSNGKQD